jgi:hypothetical protein
MLATADRPRRPVVRTGLALGLALAVVLALQPLIGDISGFLGGIHNPFASDRHERSGDTVLRALDDLSDYHAATAELQVMVEIEDDARYLPSFVKGESTTMLARGSIDAVVDLGALGPESIVERSDGTVVVTLPAPYLTRPQLDTEASRVVDRDRGALDRLGDVFSSNPVDDRDVYALAAKRLAASAPEDELFARARRNTRAMIVALLREAGVDAVVVRFETPPDAR